MRTNRAPAPKDLADLLKARGYVEIPLTLTKDPYFEVEVKIKGQALVFVLDTGTNHTFIDKAAAGRLGLASHKTDQKMFGIIGDQFLEKTESVQVSVGPNHWEESPAVNDLLGIQRIPKGLGDPAL